MRWSDGTSPEFRRFSAISIFAPRDHGRLKELLQQRKVIRTLPATGFSFWSAVGFVLVFAVDIGILLFFCYVSGKVPQFLR